MEIPNCIVELFERQEAMNKKNVLLLAMSTLPKEPGISDFGVEGKDIYIRDCVGQLEPVVKLRLESNPNNLPLRIIAMCTNDVCEMKRTFYLDGEEVTDKTSIDYFIDRVKSFASAYNTEIEIVIKDLDEGNPNKGIHDAVNYIRKNSDEMGELWIDTHGGFREVALIMEAIISLLKVDNIVPDRIYGVTYGNKKVIVDQKESFSVFDFVSGMNEFIDHGSVNILNRYYYNTDNMKIINLLSAMNKVSKGTQECDTNEYEEGLDELGAALERLDQNDSLMGIFKEYVRRSYGNLLYRDKRTTIDIIERCLEKGLTQQALTFVESRMPEEFTRRKVLYCREGELRKRGLTQEQRKHSKHKEAFKSDSNFIIDSFVARQGDEKPYIRSIIDNTDGREEKFVKKGEKIVNDTEGKKFIICSRLVDKKSSDAGRLMKMHWALKKCRNRFNHCDPDRADSRDIIEVMKRYAKLAREILEDNECFIEEDPEERLEIKVSKKKNKSGDSKNGEKIDNTIYTFELTEVIKSKKGIRGFLREKGKTGVLFKRNMKEKEKNALELRKYIENEKVIKVRIVDKSPQTGEPLVKEM